MAMTSATTAPESGLGKSAEIFRKKRTFDIAFLTGQEEESNNNNNEGRRLDKLEKSRVSLSPPSSPSECSSIVDVDIMTSEGEEGGPGKSATLQNFPNFQHFPSFHQQPQHPHPRVLLSLSHYNHKTKASGKVQGNKQSQPHHQERQRLEGESHKIKETLQFSPIPSSVVAASSQDFPEFPLLPPHLASTFALFPHMSKFLPMIPIPHHLGSPVPNPINSGQSNHNQGQQHQIQPSSGKCGSGGGGGGGLGECYPNQAGSKGRQQFSGSSPSELYHPGVGVGVGYPCYPNLIIPSSQFSPGTNPHQAGGVHSPPTSTPSPQNCVSAAATLLPPSLTALTLPAQNVCAKCNIGFRMTSDLVYHMRSHHKRESFDPLKKQREDKLKCPVCHESFRERHHLTRHMTAHQDRKEEAQAATIASAVVSSGSNCSGTRLSVVN